MCILFYRADTVKCFRQSAERGRKLVREDLSTLISQKEAAEIRGVSIAAIGDLIKRGRLAPVEIAGRKYLRRKDIVKFKALRRGRPNATARRSKSTRKGQPKGPKA